MQHLIHKIITDHNDFDWEQSVNNDVIMKFQFSLDFHYNHQEFPLDMYGGLEIICHTQTFYVFSKQSRYLDASSPAWIPNTCLLSKSTFTLRK